MEIVNFKPIDKGVFVASFGVKLSKKDGFPEGFTIYGMNWCCKDNCSWISFPSFSYEKDGKKKYLSYLRFEKLEENSSFLYKILQLVTKQKEDKEELPF